MHRVICIELSFSKIGGVHDSYTFQCGLVGYFTSSFSSERHWQCGVNGFAKVPKRSFRGGAKRHQHECVIPIIYGLKCVNRIIYDMHMHI